MKLVVVNPSAGSCPPNVEEMLASSLEGVHVEAFPQGCDLVEYLADRVASLRPDLLAVGGGDGTVSAAATAVSDSSLPLAVLPLGTANVLATELELPSIDAAIEAINAGHTRALDAADLDGGRCLCRVGVGVFGEVGPSAPPAAKRAVGGLAYAWSALPFVVDAEPRDLELVVDGRRERVRASSIIVTNVSGVGWGGLRWGDQVQVDDGALDMFVVRSQRLSENLAVLWNTFTGDPSNSDAVSHVQVRESVEIRALDDLPAVVDGEARTCKSYRLDVRPRALNVIVPVR